MLDSGYGNVDFKPFKNELKNMQWFNEESNIKEDALFGYFESMSGYRLYLNNNPGIDDELEKDPLINLKHIYKNYVLQTKKDSIKLTFPFFCLTFTK